MLTVVNNYRLSWTLSRNITFFISLNVIKPSVLFSATLLQFLSHNCEIHIFTFYIHNMLSEVFQMTLLLSQAKPSQPNQCQVGRFSEGCWLGIGCN